MLHIVASTVHYSEVPICTSIMHYTPVHLKYTNSPGYMMIHFSESYPGLLVYYIDIVKALYYTVPHMMCLLLYNAL